MIESTLEPLFHISSLPKTWTIAEVGTNFVISNSNLEGESISLYESICDESTGLDFGRCSSARFSFTTLDIDIELSGRVFDVSFTFEDEPEIPFVVGRFKVVEDKPSPDRRNRDVVMYDALYDVLNTNYASLYNGLTWTGMTLGGFIDSFLSHVGITAETASRAELINASMSVDKTLQTNELTGSTILHAVCEVAGCFGVMTRDNKFRFLYLKSDIEGLYPANDLYPAEDLYPIEPAGTLIDGSEYFPPLVYETYKAPSISKLFISESTDSLGTVVGNGDVEYDIVGNFLLFGKDVTELNTIGLNTLSAISGRVYRPFSVSKMGNLCFELGDPIRMSNDKMSVESYILERTFRGTQGFIDDISAEGVQSYTQNVKSANTTYQQLQSKTAVLRQDVDEVSSELTYQLDPTQGTPGGTHNSYAYQTAQEIGKRVTYTDFNYELDPTQAGGGGQHESYAHQTADEISQRVTTTTYNDFVNNTYGTFVTQTDSALTAKAEKTVGNFTTGFSCTLDTTGHTWYKDNQQVMKIDGTGLSIKGSITAGSTITGADIISSDSITGNTVEINNGLIDCRRGNNAVHIGPRDIYFIYNNSYAGHIQAYVDSTDTEVLYMGIAGKLDLNGTAGVLIRGGSLNLTGVTEINIGENPISAASFRRMRFISNLTYEEINMYDNILLPISNIGDTAKSAIDSHYGTSVSGSYITWTLSAFNRLAFYSSNSGRTVTLNDIISALDTLVGHNIGS